MAEQFSKQFYRNGKMLFLIQSSVMLEHPILSIRYVSYNKDTDDWQITEQFLEFKDFKKMIENVFHEKEIDIGDCRHQGCDNGANMSGRVKGVQAQILKRNHLATFSPLCLPRFKSCRCPCYTVKPRSSNIF